MNKFKYYIEMVLNESKLKEQIKIIAIFNDKNKKRRISLLHKQDIKKLEIRIFEKDTDMTKKFNSYLNELTTTLSKIKNNITEKNNKIDNFIYKLKEQMEEVKTEFQSIYNSAKKPSDAEISDSLQIEAKVKIDDNNTFIITIDHSDKLKIKKK